MRIAPSGFIAITVFAVASLVGGAGCSQNSAPGLTPSASGDHSRPKRHQKRPGPYGAISHIFIIIQENRSLNDIFAGLSIPGANTTLTGEEETASGEQQVPLVPEPMNTQSDIDHCYFDAAAAINQTGSQKPMDGFNNETLGGCPGSKSAKERPYAYLQQSPGVQPYWDLSHNWVLAANYYPTELGPSFVAHLNLIAGTTEIKPGAAVADFPESGAWGCSNRAGSNVRTFGPGTPYATPSPYNSGPPCYNEFHSIADILDCTYCGTTTKNYSQVQWRFYAPSLTTNEGSIWSAFQAIKRVYGGGTGYDWTHDVISPDWQIFKDIPAGKLDNVGVTWVVPEFIWSDHASPGLKDWGASWVGDIVNTIGESPLWSSSVIVVLWDDWGGWYDPAPPPNQDFRGLGIRTPMLIISPYDPPQSTTGYDVSQEQFSSGSTLKFIEQVFFNGESLGQLPCKKDYYYYYYGCGLGYTDSSSNSIGDVLKMNLPERAYVPITTKYPPSKFEKSGYYYPDNTPPDNQ